jgi:hypothetical protein
MWSDPGNRTGDQNGEQVLLERAQPPLSTLSSPDWIDQATADTNDEAVRARARALKCAPLPFTGEATS